MEARIASSASTEQWISLGSARFFHDVRVGDRERLGNRLAHPLSRERRTGLPAEADIALLVVGIDSDSGHTLFILDERKPGKIRPIACLWLDDKVQR